MYRIILWVVAPALGFAQGGTLRGVLTLAEGVPLAEFPVAIARIPPPVFDSKFVAWTRTVFTNADGTFELTGVPQGAYRVCPQKSLPGYVNPCLWSESASTQMVTAGQRTTVAPMVLRRSQSQIIRVEDPAQLLSQARAPDRGGPVAAPRHAIVLGLFTPAGYFVSGRLARDVGTAKEYVLDVPETGRFRFSAASATLQLADGVGRRVNAGIGLSQAVDLIPSTAPAPILVQVQGPLVPAPSGSGN